MNDIIEFLTTVHWPGAVIVCLALVVSGWVVREAWRD